MQGKRRWIARSLVPAIALGGLFGSLALGAPAAADPGEDASTKANIKPLALDRIPAEGSNPSADKTIWLDFNGGTVAHTNWNDNGNGGDDIKYAPANKLSAEQKLVVYQRLVQAYAPFDVNVRASKPSADDLLRTSYDDDEFGAVVHVTDSTGSSPGFQKIFNGAAGKAYLDGFGDPYRYDAWVTTDVFAEESAKALKISKLRSQGQARSQETLATVEDKLRAYEIGSAAVHEIAHTLGLEHHGYGNQEYYMPGSDISASGSSIWGPLMGNPTAIGLERWSNGYPNGTNNKQDDLAVLTDDLSKKEAAISRLYDGKVVWLGAYCTYEGSDKIVKSDGKKCFEDEPLKRKTQYHGRLDFRANKEANSDNVARVLTIEGGQATAWGEFVGNLGKGVGNWYRFDAAAGPVQVSVVPQAPYSLLDLKVTLYDSKLKQLGSSDPGLKNVYDGQGVVIPGRLEGQDASIAQLGTADQTYFVKVEQVSFGKLTDNTADVTVAAPKYGNLGVYRLAVQGTATAELAAPTVDPTYGQVVTGTGVAGAAVEIETAKGKIIGTATVGADGRFSAELDPAAKVGDELLVAQVQEGRRSRPVSVTVIEEPKPEVKVKIDPTKITEGDDSGVTVIGAGFESGQKVTGVVNSEPVELGTKIADEKGTVEFVFDAGKLEVGKHKVTLTAVDDKDYSGSAKLTVVKADDDDNNDDPAPSPSPDDDETPSASPSPDDDNGTPPPSDDQGGDDDLPGTGAGNALTLFGLGGLVLIGSGAAIAVAAHRRNRA